MAWFDEDSVARQAAAQAVRLADRLTLPVEARSLTREELARRERVVVRWMAIGLAAITAALLAGVWGELQEAPSKALAILMPTVLLLGLPLLLAVRWARHRARHYRDPGIAVTVDRHGVVVRNAAQRHAIGWLEIDAKVESFSGRNGIRFVGVTVKSPLGPIRLDNDFYLNGRDAAAAILGFMQGGAARIA